MTPAETAKQRSERREAAWKVYRAVMAPARKAYEDALCAIEEEP